ncbi:MAG: hypothetical protein AB1782_09445 [Cyanobacteriota bacterium]
MKIEFASNIKNKLLNIANEEKYSFFFIFITFLLLAIASWHKWGDLLLFDNPRELIVPLLITKGNILYKDIFYFYSPLIPYLFAFLISIFGFKLSLFYYTGLFLTLIYSFVLYLLARILLNKFNSCVVSILFLIQLAFFNTLVFSYILPYSYGAVIGSLLVTLMVLLLLQYNNSNNNVFFYLAVLICSINLLVKQDFFITSLGGLLFFIFFTPLKDFDFTKSIFSKRNIKKYLKSFPFNNLLLSTIIIIVISLLFYLMFGSLTGYSNLSQGLFPVDLFTLKNPTVEIFVRDDLKSVTTTENVFNFIFYALSSATIILICFFLIYSLITFYNKHGLKKLIIIILLILLSAIFIFAEADKDQQLLTLLLKAIIPSFKFIYSGINLWLIILLLYFSFNIKEKQYFNLVIITFVALISNYRMFYSLELELYAFYYLPLSLLLFVYLVSTFLPEKLNKEANFNIDSLKQASNIIFAIIILIYFLLVLGMYNIKNLEISTGFGKTFIRESKLSEFAAVKKAANYIKSNTKKSEKILVYPGHIIIYLLSNRMPASKFYFLVAGATDLKNDELRAIKDIESNKPEYIAITNEKYRVAKLDDGSYKTYQFGSKGYYKKLFNFIKCHYTIEKSFSANTKKDYIWKIDIYKLNKLSRNSTTNI